MSALLMAAVLATAPVESANVPSTSEVPRSMAEAPARTGRELRQAARESLRRWARPEDEELEAAANELLIVFRELEADTELAESLREPLLRQVRGRLARLARLARQIQVRAAAQRRLAREQRAEDAGADGVGERQPLAQFSNAGMDMQPGRGMQPGMGGQAQDDYGEELVELIQTTIRPNTWERVGGPGSIYYWRSQRAIVVRQMGEVHDEISDVLEQLNRMNR